MHKKIDKMHFFNNSQTVCLKLDFHISNCVKTNNPSGSLTEWVTINTVRLVLQQMNAFHQFRFVSAAYRNNVFTY